MHYKVEGLEIRTENAAKPIERASQWIVNWIGSLHPDTVAMDYGCGKLRYSVHLAKHCRFVHLVDSPHQLYRQQILDGQMTTVAEKARAEFRGCALHEADSSTWRRLGIDLVLCTNVLSTIPFPELRQEIVNNLAGTLKPGGRLFLCTQYTNSYYSEASRSQRGRPYNDGLLITGRHGTSFYARLRKGDLLKYILAASLEVESALCQGQTAIVIAKKTPGQKSEIVA